MLILAGCTMFNAANELDGFETILGLLRPISDIVEGNGEITEIAMSRPGSIHFYANGEMNHVHLPQMNEHYCMTLIRAIGYWIYQDPGINTPTLSTTLPNGWRIQVVIPPACDLEQIIFSIRVPDRGHSRTLASYEQQGVFTDWRWHQSEDTKLAREQGLLTPFEERMCTFLDRRNLVSFLEEAVTGQITCGILGNTGSGKTTLAKAMCALIPRQERIITIEDARELLLPSHPFTYHLLYEKKPKDKAKVTAADLIGASMRLFPTRVLLGELRGSEAWDFLKLVTTVRGCITTFHASSLGVAAERLAFMAKEHPDAATADLFELKRFALECFDMMLHISCDELFDGEGRACGLKRSVTGIWYDPGAKRMREQRG